MTTPMSWKPTPRAEWVKVGDRCMSPTGATGTVLRIINSGSLPQARVLWDVTRHSGRVTITLLVRL